MPVYNQERFIAYSICSVLRQTIKDFEFIIVDDASTDESYSIAETYASLDARIRLFKRSENGGQGAATIEAANHATGDYMAWHHSDDNYKPNFLERTLSQDADVVFGGYEMITLKGEHKSTIPKDIKTLTWDRGRLLKNCYLCCGAMLYKRSVYEEVGGYDEQFSVEVDWDFSLRATKDRNVVVLPEVLFSYRDHHLQSNRHRIGTSARKEDKRKMNKKRDRGDYG